VLHARRQRHFKPAFAAILSTEHLAIACRDIDLLSAGVMQADRHQRAVGCHLVEALPLRRKLRQKAHQDKRGGSQLTSRSCRSWCVSEHHQESGGVPQKGEELLRKLGPEFAALADEINGVNLSSQDACCRPGNANACLIVSPGN
jgi:hypothetical protein